MKKVILTILLILPIFVNASCDYTKHDEYMSYASYVTYETNYNKETYSFDVTFYNVIDGLTLRINNKKYTPTEGDIVTLKNIKQGSDVEVYIFGNDGCNSHVGYKSFKLPYYNPYYGTKICKGYEELVLCATKFTIEEPTEEMIIKMKENYDNIIIQEKEEKDPEKEKVNYFKLILEILIKYVLPVLLVVASTTVTISHYRNKMSKIEHGI